VCEREEFNCVSAVFQEVHPVHHNGGGQHSPVAAAAAGKEAKSKRSSIVEKIGKTLDKISSPSSGNSNGNSNSKRQQHGGGQFPAWVYPAKYNSGSNATISPAGRKSSPSSGRLSADNTAMLYPSWGAAAEHAYSGSPYYDYSELSYDYSHGQQASLPPCTCYESLYGSVRGPPKLCRSCRLQQQIRYKQQYSQRPLQLQQQQQQQRQPQQQNRGVDPYEYVRQSRIGLRNGVASEADWQSCWVDEEEEDKISRRSSNSTFKGGSKYVNNGTSNASLSRPPLDQTGREISKPAAGSADGIETGLRKSILGPALNPYEINSPPPQPASAVIEEEEEEEKDLCGVEDERNDGRQSEFENCAASDEGEGEEEEGDDSDGDDENRDAGVGAAAVLSRKKRKRTRKEIGESQNVKVIGDDEDDDGEAREKSAKAGTSDERKSSSGRPVRKHSSNHRYFRRSRASVHIDEVIVEEDEAAVEADNLEVISLTPPVKVRSILKQTRESSSENNVKKGVQFEMGAVASTAIDLAALSPELLLPHQKEETGSTSTAADKNGNSGVTEQRVLPKPALAAPKTSPAKKKSVAFALDPVEETFESVRFDSLSPLSLSSTSSDDEWSGYDKVIVSHNLAEEILDEIYGKLEEAKPMPEERAISDVSSNGSGYYEDVGDVSSEVSLAKALAEQAKQLQRKKSMADEILDEIYGVTKSPTAAAETEFVDGATASPLRSPKSNRSRDDSQLPDNAALIMGKKRETFSDFCLWLNSVILEPCPLILLVVIVVGNFAAHLFWQPAGCCSIMFHKAQKKRQLGLTLTRCQGWFTSVPLFLPHFCRSRPWPLNRARRITFEQPPSFSFSLYCLSVSSRPAIAADAAAEQSIKVQSICEREGRESSFSFFGQTYVQLLVRPLRLCRVTY
jgi:hypothetical protein